MSAPYHPGQQPQWRPEQPPPIQFRQEEPPPAKNKGLQWTLRIAGLVAVAVISGLVWNYFIDDTTTTPTNPAGEEKPTQSTGLYPLEPHKGTPKPDVDTNCAKHAYDDIQRFLQTNPCERLTRQLFQTEVDGGRMVYASVSVVTMPSEDKAAELRDLTDKNGTGNVSDVVKDQLVKIDGLTSLAGGGGYASTQKGRDVIIVEADFDPKDKGDETADEKILDAVCEDALRKGPEIDAESGSS
ncbi:hypothetical protein [Actinophytocola sp.]|uniref:hypothetical protein n=1 Tax=Actinophytocola sp. TaxID=1872138 RepID=UPI002ED17BDC